eukprot:18818-Eustigmatos_ZCMA.PRE.1
MSTLVKLICVDEELTVRYKPQAFVNTVRLYRPEYCSRVTGMTDVVAIGAALAMDEDVTLPQPDDWATESVLQWRQRRHTQAAAEFRESVCQRLPTHICALCAQYRVP